MSAARDNDFDDDLPDAVREAEAAVAALAANFAVWVKDDLTSARDAFAKAGATAPENAEAVQEIFGVIHNVKGQGGSFGYDLLTTIGGSLCDYLRVHTIASDDDLKVIAAHLTALEFIVARDIKGDGGENGARLVKKLARVAASG